MEKLPLKFTPPMHTGAYIGTVGQVLSKFSVIVAKVVTALMGYSAD